MNQQLFGIIKISVDFPGVDLDKNISDLEGKFEAFVGRIEDYANLIKDECLGKEGTIKMEEE